MDLGGLAGLLRDRIRACTDEFPELLLVLLLLVVTEVDAAGCCRTKPHAGSTTRPVVVSTFVGSASGTRSPLLVSTGVGLVVTVVAKHVRNLGRVIVMAPSALLGLRQDVGEAVDLSLPVRKWETEAAAIAGNADAGDAVDAER